LNQHHFHFTKGKIIMQQTDVQLGNTYLVKVAGNWVPVQITEDHPSGKGWNGTTTTGKTIRIASAQRLQQILNDNDGNTANPKAKQTKATTDTSDAPKRDTRERMATNGKPMSLINAAAYILAQGNREPMRCKDIVEQAVEQKLWQPGKGLTPASTLSAAIMREIKTKGNDSRFRKAERGKFTIATEA
jgi:hypothetical protein